MFFFHSRFGLPYSSLKCSKWPRWGGKIRELLWMSSQTDTATCPLVGDTGDWYHTFPTQVCHPRPTCRQRQLWWHPNWDQTSAGRNLWMTQNSLGYISEGLSAGPENICTWAGPISSLHHHLQWAKALLLPQQLQKVNLCSPRRFHYLIHLGEVLSQLHPSYPKHITELSLQ